MTDVTFSTISVIPNSSRKEVMNMTINAQTIGSTGLLINPLKNTLVSSPKSPLTMNWTAYFNTHPPTTT